MSKARLDLPEPDSPVTTVRVLRGISTSMFFRLCWRAPRTVIRSITWHVPTAGNFDRKPIFHARRGWDSRQATSSHGIGRVHRIPPVGLKCLSEKRRQEMTALLGGEQGRRSSEGGERDP